MSDRLSRKRQQERKQREELQEKRLQRHETPEQTFARHQEKERARQRRETNEQTINRHTRELAKKWNLKRLPQRKQPENISELTLEQHDQLLLFTLLADDRALEDKVCKKIPILHIIDSMGSFIPQKCKANIKKIGEKNGSYAAAKRFLALATVKKLKTGWSRQLCETVTSMKLKAVEKFISPKQVDLEDFNQRMGIPRNSLLDQLTVAQRNHCGILISPMGKQDRESESVPVVHPQLCVSEEHFTHNTAFTDGSYRPSEEGRQVYKNVPQVSFSDVTKSSVQTSKSTNEFSSVMKKHHNLFIFLIGVAGSGKTTMTKRMVKTCIEENKMAFLIPFAQIDKNERLKLKHLLTTFLCRLHNLTHDPSEEEIDEAFSWILTHQDKCLLIFDGLDQSSFDISNQPIEDADINGEYYPGELVSLLMSRKFLPDCRLILSSRPHSLVQIAPAIQPNIVVFLNDLLSDDVEKLMDHYLEHGSASEIMKKLQIKSPRIYQLVFTPLFLRLVAMLNNEVGDNIWLYVNTTAKLFFEVVERLQMSAHHECGLDVDDVKILNLKLAEMAFYKTEQGSVVFEQKDLERYGLSGDNVQDFLFGVMSSKHNTGLLVGLMMVFYFNHQSTQEFFSARFAVERLAFAEFKDFIKKIFPRFTKYVYGSLQVGEDSFAILRVLIIGCLNEMKSRQLDEEAILAKKQFFIEFLCSHIRRLFRHVTEECEEHQLQIMADLLDFREEEVVIEIRDHLKDFSFRFDFRRRSFRLTAYQEGFSYFLLNFTSKIKSLSWTMLSMKDDEIKKVLKSIQDSPAKIEEMSITHVKPEHVRDVLAILPHLTRELKLNLSWETGGSQESKKKNRDAVENRLQYRKKLKEEISQFDTSKLQTKELKMEYWEGHKNCESRLVLKVVLRRGKPPQVVKYKPRLK